MSITNIQSKSLDYVWVGTKETDMHVFSSGNAMVRWGEGG